MKIKKKLTQPEKFLSLDKIKRNIGKQFHILYSNSLERSLGNDISNEKRA